MDEGNVGEPRRGTTAGGRTADVADIDPAAADHSAPGQGGVDRGDAGYSGVNEPGVRQSGARSAAAGGAVPPDVEQRVRSAAGGRLDEAADAVRRLGRRAHAKGGVAGRAEPVAQRVGAGLENAAGYVRSHEAVDMRSDLEREVRQGPVRSLFIAGVVGFVVGRLIR